MSDKYFIDTNIFVYSFINQSAEKQKISQEIIVTALELQSGEISWQVVQEFINVVTKRKSNSLDISDLNIYLNQVLRPLLKIHPDRTIYQKTVDLMSKLNYSFYDCLIIASAIAANCKYIFSEDLQHQHKIERVTIINPYKK